MTTLYMKDARGQIRIWEITPDYSYGELIISHGLLNGTRTTKIERVELNQSGRDIREQVDLRLNSRVNLQLDRGYVYSLAEAQLDKSNRAGNPLPMLAQKFNGKLSGFAYVQRKYNGARCIVGNVNGQLIAYSRKGKPIESIDHILSTLTDKLKPGMFLDGELYCHNVPLQTLLSWIKRPQLASEQLNYVLYDVIDYRPFDIRQSMLVNYETETVFPAGTYAVRSADDVYSYFDDFRREGYEGAMVRIPDRGYEDGKRSSSLLKLKEWFDAEFKVVEILPSADGWAVLVCEMDSGKQFRVSAPGTMEERTYTLVHKDIYLGKMVNVEYAYLTDDGIPFHPVARYWR